RPGPVVHPAGGAPGLRAAGRRPVPDLPAPPGGRARQGLLVLHDLTPAGRLRPGCNTPSEESMSSAEAPLPRPGVDPHAVTATPPPPGRTPPRGPPPPPPPTGPPRRARRRRSAAVGAEAPGRPVAPCRRLLRRVGGRLVSAQGAGRAVPAAVPGDLPLLRHHAH